MNVDAKSAIADVSKRVFEQFLADLKTAEISSDVIERLQKMITEGDISETTIRKAVLSDTTDI
jgi:hypothetical protein